MKTLRQAIAALLLAVVAPAVQGGTALAQAVTTGGITGRAIDDAGLVLPGVTVTITSPAMIGGSRFTTTDEQGQYRFTLLTPGTYRVSFALPGFVTLNVDE